MQACGPSAARHLEIICKGCSFRYSVLEEFTCGGSSVGSINIDFCGSTRQLVITGKPEMIRTDVCHVPMQSLGPEILL